MSRRPSWFAASLTSQTRPPGIAGWGDLFNARQLLALVCFARHIGEATVQIATQYESDYATAVATILGTNFGRAPDHWASLCTWNPSGPKIQHVFGRQALPMVWDYAEANPFGGSVGDYVSSILWNGWNAVVAASLTCDHPAECRRASSTALPIEDRSIAAVVIRPAIEEDASDLKLKCHRVDVTKIGGSIITEIMEGIAHARVVLGEISTMLSGSRNPNVMYELGLAHALRQPEEVILIRKDDARINFDIASIRVHRYWPDDVPKSRQLIADTIRECVREVDLRKGLKVQQAIESLNDKCLELIEQFHKQPSFAFQQQQTMGDILSGVPINLAVLKLLELGIVRTDANMRQHLYAYHWTPFGRTVVRRLGFDVA